LSKSLSPQTALPGPGLVLLVLLTIGWGINWPIMKTALIDVPALTFRALCTVSGAGGLLLLARIARQPLRVPPGQWPRLLLLAALNITVWNIMMIYGLRLMPSGRAAILGFTMPLWGVLLSRWWLAEPLTIRRLLGLALGLGGLSLLIGSDIAVLRTAPLGAMIMVLGAVGWAAGTVAMKRWPVALPTTALVGWQMLLGGLPIIAGALLLEPGELRPVGLWPALSVLYNMVIVFIGCYWAWFKIVDMVPVGVSVLSTMLIPVVGVFSGMLLLGERPQWPDFAALILVVGALGTVLLPAPRQVPPLSRAALR